jgi:DNA-binding NtrC family response regulator
MTHADASLAIAPPLAHPGETLLVVEDDSFLRGAAVLQLRELGYQVIEANDAMSALWILSEPVQIDLLFTDMVMPGNVSGKTLVGKARRLRPTLRVLYTSGYGESALGDCGGHFLSKPYRINALAQKVRDALDTAPAP